MERDYRRISDMKVGEKAFIVPWELKKRNDNKFYLDTSGPVSKRYDPGCIPDVEIERISEAKNGFKVNIAHALKWGYDFTKFGGSSYEDYVVPKKVKKRRPFLERIDSGMDNFEHWMNENYINPKDSPIPWFALAYLLWAYSKLNH